MKISRLALALSLLAVPLACTVPEPTLSAWTSAPVQSGALLGSGSDTTVTQQPSTP